MGALENFIYSKKNNLNPRIQVLLTPYQNPTQTSLCLHLGPDKENAHLSTLDTTATYELDCCPSFTYFGGMVSPSTVTAQTPALSWLSASSSCKQPSSFFRSSAPWPWLRAAVPAHGTDLSKLFGPYFLGARQNLGQFQINYLKFELGILTYIYISFLQNPVS